MLSLPCIFAFTPSIRVRSREHGDGGTGEKQNKDIAETATVGAAECKVEDGGSRGTNVPMAIGRCGWFRVRDPRCHNRAWNSSLCAGLIMIDSKACFNCIHLYFDEIGKEAYYCGSAWAIERL